MVVENVAPNHALNEGAPGDRAFFVRVDADMILDPGCVEALREADAAGYRLPSASCVTN